MTSRALRALMVDDERIARYELRILCERVPGVEVVAEAATLREARAALDRRALDLVFLDIQLAGESGFDLLGEGLEEIDVIFVTAWDEFALRAFDVDAADYLLKPVCGDRLLRAVERVRRRRARPVVEEDGGRLSYTDRVLMGSRQEPVLLPVASIKLIRADGDYSHVHATDGRVWLVHKPLREWEQCLPRPGFFRIHRGTIVNADWIDRLAPWSNYSYLVYLRDHPEPLPMSRRYAVHVRRSLR